MTTQQLDNLISQTEYDVTVTPVYDSRTGSPMQNKATTGKEFFHSFSTERAPRDRGTSHFTLAL